MTYYYTVEEWPERLVRIEYTAVPCLRLGRKARAWQVYTFPKWWRYLLLTRIKIKGLKCIQALLTVWRYLLLRRGSEVYNASTHKIMAVYLLLRRGSELKCMQAPPTKVWWWAAATRIFRLSQIAKVWKGQASHPSCKAWKYKRIQVDTAMLWGRLYTQLVRRSRRTRRWSERDKHSLYNAAYLLGVAEILGEGVKSVQVSKRHCGIYLS